MCAWDRRGLERLIVDVENAQRGYLLTGRPGFLQSWLVSSILELRAAQTAADLDAVALGLGGALDDLRGAEPTAGGGLIGLVDRVQALGGSLSITSPSGQGTTLEATLPRSK
jgi:glucose-6-phosphate-specific signal transduction histidine kinase